ncbi:MAG: T9SS type A sorting domain-containing protein [Bacteroidetes bacterium]|nr:T9SS type A sorting domain-containing protein [Bacteroidota bacterium]
MKKIVTFMLFVFIQQLLFAQYRNVYKSERPLSSGIVRTASKQSLMMDKYDVKFYKLDINVERTSVYIEGNVTIKAKVIASQLDTFVFELKDYFVIDSILINNQKRIFSRVGDDVFVGINSLNVGSNISTQIFYKGMAPNTGTFFSGISNKTDVTWGNQVTWTLSESFAAKEWFPVKQSLTDKADSAYIFVTTSNENKVGSEGKLTAVVPLPNNKVRYEWKTFYPIDYYLISISVGKYVDYSIYAHPNGIQDSILIQNYVYDNPLTLSNFKTEIDRTPSFIELYSNLFGVYPFYKEKYGHSMAPLGGGMEHQTMTTLGDFNFYLTSHELSHQWWGDNVTCATWSDIWINEGFASYCEYLAAQNLWSQQEAQQHMLQKHNNIMSHPDGSVYIPPYLAVDENRIFDGRLSYDKGAAIIHNLRFEVDNDSIFFQIFKMVQIRFKDSTITGLDFKAVAEELSGKNFNDFFNQWYYGEGHPIIDIVYGQKNDTLIMNVHQLTSAAITPLFKMNMEYKVKFSTCDTIIKLYHQANTETFKIPMQKQVKGLEIDPNNWVVNGNGSIKLIADTEVVSFVVFPNPCSDYLQFYLRNNGNYKISVFDVTGQNIMSEININTEMIKLNIQNLEKGIYFLQISDGVNKNVEKFVKY